MTWKIKPFSICFAKELCLALIGEVSFVLSLNDDSESNVLKVIQNVELLIDLRETS